MSSEGIYREDAIVDLKPVDVVTGEENERLIYKDFSKLFRFSQSNKEQKERGTGEVRFLQDKKTKIVRIVMRQEKTFRVVMNQINKKTKIVRIVMRQEKTFRVVMNQIIDARPSVSVLTQNMGNTKTRVQSAVDYSDENPEIFTFAIRFPKPEAALAFEQIYNKAKANNGLDKPDDFTELSSNNIPSNAEKQTSDKSNGVVETKSKKILEILIDKMKEKDWFEENLKSVQVEWNKAEKPDSTEAISLDTDSSSSIEFVSIEKLETFLSNLVLKILKSIETSDSDDSVKSFTKENLLKKIVKEESDDQQKEEVLKVSILELRQSILDLIKVEKAES